MFNQSSISKMMVLSMGTAGVGAGAGILVPQLTRQVKTEQEIEKEQEIDNNKDVVEEDSVDEEKIEEESDSEDLDDKKDEIVDKQETLGEEGEEVHKEEESGVATAGEDGSMKEETESTETEDVDIAPQSSENAVEKTNPESSGSLPEVADTNGSNSTSTKGGASNEAESKLRKGEINFTFLEFDNQQQCSTDWAAPEWTCKVLAEHKTKTNHFLGFVFKTSASLSENIKAFCVWVNAHAKATDLGDDWKAITTSTD